MITDTDLIGVAAQLAAGNVASGRHPIEPESVVDLFFKYYDALVKASELRREGLRSRKPRP